MSKHKTIPVFIPHLGCPHRCIFCDQCTIAGQSVFDPSCVKQEIDRALATMPADAVREIAFFGGSFTAIDRDLMVSLLDLAQGYVDAAKVSGIRFSTRPDALGEDILDILSRYTVSAVEIGLQSMHDEVLTLCRRGHTAATARDACRRAVARGFSLVGQMMVGLPGSTAEREMATAREICDLGARAVRIYPTVVFDGTALGRMMQAGEYTPLGNAEAAERCAPLLDLFEARGVAVLRVGLCASEQLSSSRVLGGANHPALGEMCYAALYRRRMEALLSAEKVAGKRVEFRVAPGRLSQALGQKRQNVRLLTEKFSLAHLCVCEDAALSGTQILR